MNKLMRHPTAVRERAVRMVLEQQVEHRLQWATYQSIAGKIGCRDEIFRRWMREEERGAPPSKARLFRNP